FIMEDSMSMVSLKRRISW
ncbi:hypothetical protein A2U01_0107474, partial [Trifolium medium]|nr:hypothetical protein [Trifolium medium]